MPEVCAGIEIAGRVIAEARNCAQKIRGKIFDATSGEVFAEISEREVSPGERVPMEFSFNMPRRFVSLQAIIERYNPEEKKWETVETLYEGLDFREPKVEIGGIQL